jgi:hypothetical protein
MSYYYSKTMVLIIYKHLRFGVRFVFSFTVHGNVRKNGRVTLVIILGTYLELNVLYTGENDRYHRVQKDPRVLSYPKKGWWRPVWWRSWSCPKKEQQNPSNPPPFFCARATKREAIFLICFASFSGLSPSQTIRVYIYTHIWMSLCIYVYVYLYVSYVQVRACKTVCGCVCLHALTSI